MLFIRSNRRRTCTFVFLSWIMSVEIQTAERERTERGNRRGKEGTTLEGDLGLQ
jgi:hypothetical protein